MARVEWLDEPEHHDYGAALDVLTLVMDPLSAAAIVSALEKSSTTERAAKDVLRMSGEPLLPEDNSHVAKNLRRIHDGEPISPVLLAVAGGRLIVADGYHRVCAVYHHDEDTPVRCRIAHQAHGGM